MNHQVKDQLFRGLLELVVLVVLAAFALFALSPMVRTEVGNLFTAICSC